MSQCKPWRGLWVAAALFTLLASAGVWAQPSAPAASPHGMPAASKAPPSQDTAELPAGTVEVQLLDSTGAPVVGKEVRLDILLSSIEQGDTRSQRTALSGPQGTAHFADLQTTTAHSYTVTVDSGPAKFGNSSFNLRRDMGRREVITLYPVTRDQKQTQVVGRGVIAVHPRDDVFVIEVLYQVLNVGRMAWVPDNVILRLPSGWKAFTAQESESGDTRFEESETGARLGGTFTPGGHEVGFRFHLPNPHLASTTMTIPLFPRTFEMRVIVDASQEMTLSVPGYDEAFPDRMRTGQRVLVAQKSYLERQEESPASLTINIGGMRAKGNGHQVALGFAVLIMGFGCWQAWRSSTTQKAPATLPEVDQQRARELLLAELVSLEKAHHDKVIGNKAYGQTRQFLLLCLARIESSTAKPA